MAFGLSAGAVTAIGMGAGALLGGSSGGSSQSGSATSTSQFQMDPRMQAILYGSGRTLRPGVTATYGPSTASTQRWVDGGGGDGHYETVAGGQGAQTNPDSDYTNDTGLLGRITGLLDQGQKPGMGQFGAGIDSYLHDWGTDNFMRSQQAAQRLQEGNIDAPTMSAAQVQRTPGMNAAQINAPSQNGTNLAPAYQQMIYGDPAQNPYLTGAIQKGINQSSNAFGNMQTDATRNLLENILPNIRGGAIINGQMGSSRQGVAEGRALNDFSTQMGRAASQFGQNNTDAAVGAQAGAFGQGQDRALSAMSGLGAQQYGTATNDAQMRQQAEQTNYQGSLQRAAQEAQMRQAAAQANLQAGLTTNQLNSANHATGITASSGLLGQAYGVGGNNDAYSLNRTGAVSGLLTPYTGLGGSQTQTQPLYTNTAGNVMGGAAAGLGLYNAYKQAGGAPTGGYDDEMARLNTQAVMGG